MGNTLTKWLALGGVLAMLALVATTALKQSPSLSDAPVTAAQTETVAPQAPTGLVFADQAAFRAEVRSYLLDNPEVIMEAVQVLEARQAEAQAQNDTDRVSSVIEQLHNADFAWETGNPDGDVVMVEFMDYRCTYCRRAHAEVYELIETDGNIRLVVIELPILGDASVVSSRFAISVLQLAGSEAYQTAHDALMTLRGEPDAATLSQLAVEMGLEPEVILAHADSDDVTAVIAAGHQLAGALDIQGTPSFVLNDQMIRGYLPLDAMRAAVADLRG